MLLQIQTLHLASGLGKTRFGKELHSLLKGLYIEDPTLAAVIRNRCHYIFIEFNGEGDRIFEENGKKPEAAITAIGFRLFARGLFGQSSRFMRSKIQQEEYDLFETPVVMKEIIDEIRRQTNCKQDEHIMLLIHLDEHQLVVQSFGSYYMKVISIVSYNIKINLTL